MRTFARGMGLWRLAVDARRTGVSFFKRLRRCGLKRAGLELRLGRSRKSGAVDQNGVAPDRLPSSLWPARATFDAGTSALPWDWDAVPGELLIRLLLAAISVLT